MPAYNCEQFIGESINSVLNQTYQNWELIVVDDCSTDNTEKIVKEYKDKRIKLFSNEKNMGVAYSRNKGIKLSKADYIAFLDSDDIWDTEKLKMQIETMNDEINFTFTGSKFVNENGEKSNYILNVPLKIKKKELLKQNVISCSSVVVKKQLVLDNIFPENVEEIHEDYVAWLNILNNEKFAYGINLPLLIYRIRNNSKSANKIKSAIMNYNVYRYIGISKSEILKYMFFYICRSISKYSSITINNKEKI